MPSLHAYLTLERQRKSRWLLTPMVDGAPKHWRARVLTGEFQPGAAVHLVNGMLWKSERIIPAAREAGAMSLHMDNGWVLPGRGGQRGFYRLTINGPRPLPPELMPRSLCGMTLGQLQLEAKRWRRNGRHILLALPGPFFGRPWGIDMQPWLDTIQARLRAATDRPVVIRAKDAPHALDQDLLDCWAVVTHSSNVAVDAVLAGVPVFVEPTSPAAPVGNLSLEAIESPICPPRHEWITSLLAQQFLLQDFREGHGYRFLDAVREAILPPGTPQEREPWLSLTTPA